MSGEELPVKCKTRFKGVENFLRRIAFNLGNTPSQTEVKIISCIPIDVTDLQQKIICLEKQLDEASKNKTPSKPTSTVHTAIGTSVFQRPNTSFTHSGVPNPSVPLSQIAEHCRGYSPTHRESTCSIVRPDVDSAHSRRQTHYAPIEISEKNCKLIPYRHNIFKKDKKFLKKKKMKEELVYYAQTDTSPFNNYVKTMNTTSKSGIKRESDIISKTYLAGVVRKQYNPEVMIAEFSDSSQFSSPICRDIDPNYHGLYESDICSCCYGRFQNIDNELTRQMYCNSDDNNAYVNSCGYISNTNSYYDSKFYDVVPVKEKPIKIKKIDEKLKKKETKNVLDIMCQPENVRPKPSPYIVNYNTISPIKGLYGGEKLPPKIQNKKENNKSTVDRNKFNQQTGIDTSRSTCIDCGDIYIKHLYNKKIQRLPEPKKPLGHKNAECLTVNLTDMECQTMSSRSVQLDPIIEESSKPVSDEPNKTEVTLNQIKVILQSVLSEVRTSTQSKNTPEKSPKKDAIVQKGISTSNLQACSSFLQNYPYNVNPYVASCSRQMTSGPLYYPNPYSQAKYMQNFPLFVHQPIPHMCSNYYKHNYHTDKPNGIRNANTTSTNTEQEGVQEKRSKETEKLIKEIYKSMALNMGFPTKDSSTSDYGDLSSTINYPVNKYQDTPPLAKVSQRKVVVTKPSIVSKRIIHVNKSTTPTSTKFQLSTQVISDAANVKTNVTSSTDTDNRQNFKSDDQRCFKKIEAAENNEGSQPQKSTVEKDRASLRTHISVESTDSEDTETGDSESESDDTVVAVEDVKKKENKGLFSKMFRSMKLFKSRRRRRVTTATTVGTASVEEDESEASDSDDYQTVYSQKVVEAPRVIKKQPVHVRKVAPQRSRNHSKIFYKKQHDRSRRSPYMEQEYRRRWDEQLIFEKPKTEYTTDMRHSKETTGTRQHPAYWRNYEARNVLVNHGNYQPMPIPMHVPMQMRMPMPMPTTYKPPQTMKIAMTTQNSTAKNEVTDASKRFSWFKKNACVDNWKKFILEN